MKQKSAEEILAASRPRDIFTMDFSVIESEKEEYLSRFKPEPYNTVRNFMVAQKVTLLYRQAIRILNGEEENLSLVISDPDGNVHSFDCEYIYDIKLGKMYVSESHVIFLIDERNEKYYRNYIEKATKLPKLNKKVWQNIQYMLPDITHHFKCSNGDFAIIIKKPCKIYPLREILNYFEGALAPEYVASIMTRLYNFVCYIDVVGLNHNGIVLDSLFFAPGKVVEEGESYTVDDMRIVGVYGGWFFTTGSAEVICGMPREVYELIPAECKKTGFSNFEVDELSIKRLAKELLGAGKVGENKIPYVLVEWLNTTSVQNNSYEEYVAWEKVRNQAFDGHRFIPMDVSIH